MLCIRRPPEVEWIANLVNPRTRRAYWRDILDFIRFASMRQPGELARVVRVQVIAWRQSLQVRALSPAKIRRNLAAPTALH